MNLHRRIAILAAAIIAGSAHSLAAEEKADVNQAGNVSPPAISEQEFIMDSNLEETPAPEQVIVQTEEKFLSEMKVYPAF